MQNLEIVSTTTNVQAKETINGAIVNYSYNHVVGVPPLAVVFNVQRDEQTPNAMSGTFYPQNEKFEVNTTSYQVGDGALQEQIFETCKNIVESLTPTEPEE